MDMCINLSVLFVRITTYQSPRFDKSERGMLWADAIHSRKTSTTNAMRNTFVDVSE